MKKLLFLTALLTSSLFVAAQHFENFESQTNGATSFVSDGQLFTVASTLSYFYVQGSYPSTGWNGSAKDNKYLDNTGYTSASQGVNFTISSTTAFRMHSVWLYVSTSSLNLSPTGTVQIIGLLNDTEVFNVSRSNPFNPSASTNNGFTLFNFSVVGGADVTGKNINALKIITTSGIGYLSVDAFKWYDAIPAIVTADNASAVTAKKATINAAVSSNGGTPITEYGVVYDINPSPTVANNKVIKGTTNAIGNYSTGLNGLTPGTTYYARAYATNAIGTVYSANDITFTTNAALAIAGTQTNVSCFGINNGTATVTVTGGDGNYNYQWSPSVSTTSTATNLSSGSYSVTVTEGDGFTQTKQFTITQPDALSVSLTESENTVTAIVTGGTLPYTYSWSSAAITGPTASNVPAGTYDLTITDANGCQVQQSVIVKKHAQTITAAALTKAYSSPDFESATTTSGLQLNYASSNPDVATIVNNKIHLISVGTTNITVSQAGNQNYLAATPVVQVLTVEKAPVTVTAAAKTKVYGDGDPAFTYTATGIVNGDAATGTLARTAGISIGDYVINQGTLSYGNNYNITYVPANLTITKRPITVLPVGKTKVYGEADPFLNQFQITAGSLAPTDATSDQYGRAPGENAGTYLMTLGTKKIYNGSTDVTTNYDITVQTAYVTITAKPITINAAAQTKTYGDYDPTFSYSNDALAFSDSFTGVLTRVTGDDIGTYTINQGNLALSSNYAINFNGNSLTIGKKTINVTANAQAKTYGNSDPALTYTADALVSGDGFTGSLTRDAGEDVGNHAITRGSLALSNNYTLNYTDANLSIGKATLTYVAIPASRIYLTANPTFTGTVTGFLNGDSKASATIGTLSFTSPATISSTAGSYPISGEGLNAANYDFVQDAANSTALTITASNDATLAGLAIDQGTLTPAFSSSQENYGANVANDVTSFNISATLNQQNAHIKINGQLYTPGSSKNIALNTGQNDIEVIVTAEDAVTIKSYYVRIHRTYSSNNLLTSLSLSGITVDPSFDTNTLSYTAAVGNGITSTNIDAAAADISANVFVGGTNITENGTVNYPLQVGENYILIVSKAENGNDRTYTVKVTRAQSSDATLTSIGNNSLTLNTPFVSNTHTYNATVATSVGALTFLPIAANNAASIKINNQNLNPGFGNNVPLSFGTNSISIDVISEDGLSHISYVLNINRPRSTNATLASLSFPFITSLNEEFNPGILEYTATVTDSTYTGIPLSAISADENAIVKIDGAVVPRFINYTLPVHGGPNTYHIVVTSQDTSVTKTYILVLTRSGTPPPLLSPIANLLALNVSSGTTFSKNFNFSMGEVLTTIYTPNNIEAVRISTVSEKQASIVTVNGVTLPYGMTTDLVPISVGDNVFTIVVTSEDGTHTKTYDVHVIRLPFADITLASLTLNKGTLMPLFSPGTRTYNVTLPYSVSTLDVTPVANNNTASVTIGTNIINASNPTASVNLSANMPNRIRVIVTAADGINTQVYTIIVTRSMTFTDASLAGLVTSSPISPVFSSEVTDYTAAVGRETSSFSVTPEKNGGNASVTVNGTLFISGTATQPLISGPNKILIKVIAEDGITSQT